MKNTISIPGLRNTPTMVLLCLISSLSLTAATFYVDDDGNDSNSGTLASPFKTIQKASDVMVSGDTCFIRQGIYRETVKAGEGEIFMAYNSEYVLITGNDVLTGSWAEHSGNIYKTTVNSMVFEVFVNNDYMNKAQYPDFGVDHMSNSAWAPTTSFFVSSNDNKIVFNNGMNIPDGYWNGGWYTGLGGINCFSGNNGKITSSSGNEIHITDVEYRQTYNNAAHFGSGSGYIINHLNALTSPKEWHWENNTLYLYAPDGGSPESNKVEVRVRLWGFDCADIDNVIISGLHFKAASINMKNSNNSLIDNCTFRYISPWGNHKYPESSTQHLYYGFGGVEDGTSGIHIQGTNNTIQNCYVAHGWHGLISIRGSHNTVQNNYIEDCGWLTREMGAGVIMAGHDNLITNNTIRHGTAMLIGATDIEDKPTYGNTVRNNDINNFGYIMVDGGEAGIYFNTNDDKIWPPSELAYNIIWYGHAENFNGIYMDDGTQNLLIHHNVVSRIKEGDYVDRGIWLHGNFEAQSDIYVYNNTIHGITGNQSIWKNAIGAYNREGRYTNIVYKNNLASIDGFVNATNVEANFGKADTSYYLNAEKISFRLSANAVNAIDKGVFIDGITDGYTGSAPDIGAYEYNGTDWTAGSDIDPLSLIWCDNDPSSCNIPAPPSSLSATLKTPTEVILSWKDNSDNESGFKIERNSESGPFYQVAVVGTGDTTYSNTGLSFKTSYSFRVCAYNTDGNSLYSNEVGIVTPDTLPDAPSELYVFDVTSDKVILRWTDNANNEDGFIIERKTESGSYTEIASIGTDTTHYFDEGLNSSTIYTYRIKAYNEIGSSLYSNEISTTTTNPSAPDSPSKLEVFSVTTDQVILMWEDNSNNEDGFNIERKTGSGNFSQMGTIGTDTAYYYDEGLSPATTYTYRVSAYNNIGVSSYSNEVSATTSNALGSPTHSLPDFYLFPNPAKDELFITGSTNFSLKIYNLNGKLIFLKGDIIGKQRIDISSIKEGVYILHLENDKKTEVKKLLIR